MRNVGREEAEGVSDREQQLEEGSRGGGGHLEPEGKVSRGRNIPLPWHGWD